jgi:hypothetical protein
MFKKFEDGDLFVNRIEAHPKVELFVSNGALNSIHHNRKVETAGSVVPDGHVYLNNLIHPVFSDVIPPDFIDSFEFVDGWSDITLSVPSPTFASVTYNEDFDSTWSGT